jgi:hypothetical protein
MDREYDGPEHRAIFKVDRTVDEDVVLVAASGESRFGYALLRAADFTARRMRARPIDVFLPEDLRTRPLDEALRATDFLAAIRGSVGGCQPPPQWASVVRDHAARRGDKRRGPGADLASVPQPTVPAKQAERTELCKNPNAAGGLGRRSELGSRGLSGGPGRRCWRSIVVTCQNGHRVVWTASAPPN